MKRIKRIDLTRPYEKAFARLPKNIRETTYEKLELFQENPFHPSLRVKRIQGTKTIWEMSVNMNYRITFEFLEEGVLLRKIGTHDILKTP